MHSSRRSTVRCAGLVTALVLGGFCLAALAFAAPVGAVTVLSYNVQNLFDDVDDGLEYDEYRSSSGWDRDAYFARLSRVDEVVRLATGATLVDAIVLQEVESPRVALDLSGDFLRRYRHIASGEPGRTTTQVVVLTRRAPEMTRAHRAVEVELVPGGEPRTVWSSRAVVDVVLAGGKTRLFAAHWKSQSGGTEATAPLRIREARLVRGVVASAPPAAGAAVLLVGDLNESPTADDATGAPAMPAPRTALATLTDPIPGLERRFRTLWVDEGFPGSYYFRGAWSRLDHAYLLAPPAASSGALGTLTPIASAKLLDRSGIPLRYDPRRRFGYSDHLPILVTVTTARSR